MFRERENSQNHRKFQQIHEITVSLRDIMNSLPKHSTTKYLSLYKTKDQKVVVYFCTGAICSDVAPARKELQQSILESVQSEQTVQLPLGKGQNRQTRPGGVLGNVRRDRRNRRGTDVLSHVVRPENNYGTE